MHPDQVRTVRGCEDRHRERAFEPTRRVVDAGERPDEALAGCADHDRRAQHPERGHRAQQREVVLHGLTEPDPRIDAYALLGDAGEHGRLDPFPQELVHLGHDIVVARVVLHRLRLTEHVQQHDPGPRARDDLEEPRVATRRDVVDDAGAGVQRGHRHLRFARIDAHRGPRPSLGEPLDHRDHAPELLVDLHRVRAGAGRLSAHVDEVRAFVDQPRAVGHRLFGAREHRAVAEGVRRDVHDAHHEGASAERERLVAAYPDPSPTRHGAMVDARRRTGLSFRQPGPTRRSPRRPTNLREA